MKKLEFFELIICRKIMNLFEMIASKHTWDDTEFCIEWLKSFTLERTVNYDQTLFCQDVTYYYDEIMSEFGHKLKETGNAMYLPALGWFGYLTMHWIYQESITPQDILNNYEINSIILDYPVLHTYSIERAIEDIKEKHI